MGVTIAIELLTALAANIGPLAGAIQRAQSEGRENLTKEDWAGILDRDDLARANQKAALARAESEGR